MKIACTLIVLTFFSLSCYANDIELKEELRTWQFAGNSIMHAKDLIYETTPKASTGKWNFEMTNAGPAVTFWLTDTTPITGAQKKARKRQVFFDSSFRGIVRMQLDPDAVYKIVISRPIQLEEMLELTKRLNSSLSEAAQQIMSGKPSTPIKEALIRAELEEITEEIEKIPSKKERAEYKFGPLGKKTLFFEIKNFQVIPYVDTSRFISSKTQSGLSLSTNIKKQELKEVR